ncbi:MAG: DUF6171 family protein [Lachnospiraceae bacterium]|nr:DUF6171 family protein [Lachnospiraceae bacterium]
MNIEDKKDQIGAAPNTSEPRRFCRKCLTREMEQTEYFRTLHEYIEHLDADLKVSSERYEERLALCKECEKLYQGMCRICGCYVELRAVMKKNSCPLVKPAWTRVQEASSEADCE